MLSLEDTIGTGGLTVLQTKHIMHSISTAGETSVDRRPIVPMDGSSGQSAIMTSLRGRPFNMSLDDYSRVMLEYTLRQLAAFIDVDPGNRHNSVGSSSSSGSSKTSGRSNTSTVGELARGAIGASSSSTAAVHTAPEVSSRTLKKNAQDIHAHF